MSDNTVSRLRREVEELENWKAEQQSALMKISFQMLNVGCPRDGVVDGAVWMVSRVRELENKTADLAAENTRLREWVATLRIRLERASSRCRCDEYGCVECDKDRAALAATAQKETPCTT